MTRAALLGFGARMAPLIAFLVFWQWTCEGNARRTFYYSTPVRLVQSFWVDLTTGDLLWHTAVTLSEAAVGFLAGNLVGAAFGLSLWYSPTVARVGKPYLVALAATPVFAVAPMTILWFGVGWEAKAVLAFLATVFLATAQAYRGAEQVDPLHLRRLRVFGASRGHVFRHLLVPTALVWVLSSLRLTVGAALLGAFLGEYIAADAGLGYMIVKASGLYDTPRVLEGVLMIVALAVAANHAIDRVERHALVWRPRAER